jgi:hypothetical protein
VHATTGRSALLHAVGARFSLERRPAASFSGAQNDGTSQQQKQ